MIEISFLQDYESLEMALREVLGSSRQQIKQSLNSKQRKLPIKKRQAYFVPLNLVNYLRINPNYQGPEISIVHECENFLVLDKPHRVHTHPLQYADQDCVHNWLRQVGKLAVLQVNTQSYDRGFVHRLDFETSGLLIAVKKEQLYHSLLGLKTAHKEYTAIVSGRFEQDRLYHQLNGKDAHLEILARHFDQASDRTLLRIRLFEGHRHQIRKQLAKEGFPILGDKLYGAQEHHRLELRSCFCQLEYQGTTYQWQVDYK